MTEPAPKPWRERLRGDQSREDAISEVRALMDDEGQPGGVRLEAASALLDLRTTQWSVEKLMRRLRRTIGLDPQKKPKA